VASGHSTLHTSLASKLDLLTKILPLQICFWLKPDPTDYFDSYGGLEVYGDTGLLTFHVTHMFQYQSPVNQDTSR